MFANDLELIDRIAVALMQRRERIGTAESCTGGLIAAACTSLAGSSQWFERGVVSYSNEAKAELLGVPKGLIALHGAVSAEVAEHMARGLLAHAPLDWALSVTGIAGPTGGSEAKPVGTVWLALVHAGRPARV
ncbi:MAG TPA: CinA family protein, partial [Roseateles sp.]|uniref:CinA family protein n=1 Tax=Roseateles sp. TaxID=1971397 RepID=UPI002ED83728